MESLMDDLRAEKGCLDYHVCRDFKDPNTFLINNKWKQKNDLMNHIQSDSFDILIGAITNLCEEIPMDIDLSASTENLLEIELTLKNKLSNIIHIQSKSDT
jgi:quinol monooxygenase YgiN